MSKVDIELVGFPGGIKELHGQMGNVWVPCKPMEVDKVNNPPQYNKGATECIDAIESAIVNLQGIEAFCTGNAIKYLWRWKDKNGHEDLEKAKWYIDRLIGVRK